AEAISSVSGCVATLHATSLHTAGAESFRQSIKTLPTKIQIAIPLILHPATSPEVSCSVVGVTHPPENNQGNHGLFRYLCPLSLKFFDGIVCNPGPVRGIGGISEADRLRETHPNTGKGNSCTT